MNIEKIGRLLGGDLYIEVPERHIQRKEWYVKMVSDVFSNTFFAKHVIKTNEELDTEVNSILKIKSDENI